MKIYLINKETNEIVREFENVQSWDMSFVIYNNNGYLGKAYCADNEYFTDVCVKPRADDLVTQDLIIEDVPKEGLNNE